MKYQDELECDHCKNIDEEISKFRKKQMDKMKDKLEKILNKKKSKEKKGFSKNRKNNIKFWQKLP